MKMFFNLLFLFSVLTSSGGLPDRDFNKSAFYSAVAAFDISLIDAQLDILGKASFSEKEAYEGTLLMKKASLVNKAKEKLSLFKAGRSKLEASIKKNAGNAEYNFLRLIIQEHAPKVVNYRGNLEQDAQIVRSNFKKFPLVVQQAIQDYSKKSRLLNLG